MEDFIKLYWGMITGLIFGVTWLVRLESSVKRSKQDHREILKECRSEMKLLEFKLQNHIEKTSAEAKLLFVKIDKMNETSIEIQKALATIIEQIKHLENEVKKK